MNLRDDLQSPNVGRKLGTAPTGESSAAMANVGCCFFQSKNGRERKLANVEYRLLQIEQGS